jgi:hypothetical protein
MTVMTAETVKARTLVSATLPAPVKERQIVTADADITAARETTVATRPKEAAVTVPAVRREPHVRREPRLSH